MPPGDHHAHSYAFYSVTRDLGGSIEAAPAIPDVSTVSLLAVDAPSAPGLELEGVQPNPAREWSRVWFTLPGSGPASLELMDVAGRRVLRRDVGALGPGRHSVTLAVAALRPGLYFVRLRRDGRVLARRVAVIR